MSKEYMFSDFDSDDGYAVYLEVSNGKWKMKKEARPEMQWRSGDVIVFLGQQTFIKKENSAQYAFEVPGLLDSLDVGESYSAVLIASAAFRNIDSLVCTVKRTL